MNINRELSQKEIAAFTSKSNLHGLWLLIFNWGLIIVAFILPFLWLNLFTVLVSLVILANRQLGLAILMHECAHNGLFKSLFLNKWIGQVFCAAPVLADLQGYQRYHMKHHKEAGTTIDPDYPNYKNYPVTKASFRRKIVRDLTGITGLKTLYATLLMNAGIVTYDMSYQSNNHQHKLSKGQVLMNLAGNLFIPVIFHSALWGIFYALEQPYLYALWWLSYFTVYMFILRVRNAAEHGSVPNLLDKNPLQHARTTYAAWWERLTFAPNYVNYHLEHHLRPNVPCYHLKAFHQFLLSKQLLKGVNIAPGYINVVKQLIRE